jgi:hypothetical protein
MRSREYLLHGAVCEDGKEELKIAVFLFIDVGRI